MLSGTSKLAHAGKITFSAPVNEFLHGLGHKRTYTQRNGCRKIDVW
jgi:hypothetical protein